MAIACTTLGSPLYSAQISVMRKKLPGLTPHMLTLLGALLVVVVALLPAAEYACDAAPGTAHTYNHVCTSPAVSADGPAVPAVVPVGTTPTPTPAVAPRTSESSIFVPPRS